MCYDGQTLDFQSTALPTELPSLYYLSILSASDADCGAFIIAQSDCRARASLTPSGQNRFRFATIAIAWLAMEITSVVIAMRVTRIAKVLEESERRDN